MTIINFAFGIYTNTVHVGLYFREEEVAQFKLTIENPAFKANPLAAINEHLQKRIRQEDEI